MNYPQTLEYLFSQLPMFQRIGAAAYKADLGNTLALIDILGHPERKFKSVHVAGTNGKGSVSHLLASVLQEAGYKTGLYTSPHLKDFRERIRINGKIIPKGFVTQFVASHKRPFEQVHPSFFEYSAVMAFDYFAKENVDVAILETGMGGRLDSTNVVVPLLSIITNISLDHTTFLGSTLERIAIEKAGIIKPGVPVVIGETHETSSQVFQRRAHEMKAPIAFADAHCQVVKSSAGKGKSGVATWKVTFDGKSHLEGLKCPLEGNYQARNLATLFMAIEEMKKQGFVLSDRQVRSGIEKVKRNTGLMGRWQVIGDKPRIICDVGHNEAGIRCILEQLQEENHRQLHWVFGLVNDKDSEGILNLLPKDAIYYFCKANIPRGKDASELQREAKSHGLKGKIYATVSDAFQAAKWNAGTEDLIFVGGSTFVVAEVL